jgi:glucosamine--fructose-6-phosphate aminotransferase (isomerizing)
VSQSGETFDTLEICRAAVQAGAVLTSISNVPNSTQERLATHRLQQGSGPEICVLSTKSIVSQVLLLARLALETGRTAGTLTETVYQDHVTSLGRLPGTLRGLLAQDAATIQALAKKYSAVEDWFFIGRGALYPAACESALKFKEVSYRHAEGMAAGFFKHGTISLIDENFHTVALLPSDRTAPARYATTLAAVSEIAARGGPVIGLGPAGADPDDLRDFTDYLPLPYHGDTCADVVVQLVAGQLLAYYCALDLGREIDQPRSLAKSVTVR